MNGLLDLIEIQVVETQGITTKNGGIADFQNDRTKIRVHRNTNLQRGGKETSTATSQHVPAHLVRIKYPVDSVTNDIRVVQRE